MLSPKTREGREQILNFAWLCVEKGARLGKIEQRALLQVAKQHGWDPCGSSTGKLSMIATGTIAMTAGWMYTYQAAADAILMSYDSTMLFIDDRDNVRTREPYHMSSRWLNLLTARPQRAG